VILAMVGAGQLGSLTHREEAFGIAIRELLPAGFTGLMFAAILAAQMSTLSAFMVASSALLARNVYKEHIHPAADDRRLLSVARWVGLIVVALGVGFSFMVSGVAEALTIFWGVTTFTGVFMWFGVLWRRTNAVGAWASFIIMAVVWLGLGPIGAKLQPVISDAPAWLGMYGDKSLLHLLVLSYLPAGVIALVVGSLAADKRRVPAAAWTGAVVAAWLLLPIGPIGPVGHMAVRNCLAAGVVALLAGLVFPQVTENRKLDRFYQLLKTPVGREGELTESGVDIVYAGSSEGHPWELKHPRLVNIGGFLIALAFALAILGLLYVISRIGA